LTATIVILVTKLIIHVVGLAVFCRTVTRYKPFGSEIIVGCNLGKGGIKIRGFFLTFTHKTRLKHREMTQKIC